METAESYIESKLKIITKADERGQSQLVPFKLWPSQRFYIRNRTNRDICVKNRQQGFSTGVMADNARILFTQPFERQNIVAHDQDTAEWLFFTVERFHRNLPPAERPKVDWKSGQRMRFPHLDSYIYVDSAQSEHLSLGRTLTRAHLSEMAKWPPRQADALYADVSQTVPEHGYITIESTPKGRNGKFYELYQGAKKGENNYKPFFFAWWWDITCIRTPKEKFELNAEEQQLINYVRMADNIELTPQHIAFRREKIAELGDLFFQEYPENDTDCWLAGEMGVFDGIAIRSYLQRTWEGKQEGNLTIWKDVIGTEKYVIGVDVAAGIREGDYSVAAVLNVKRNEYVARLRGKIPPDMFAQELFRLGHRFNDAEIAVERIGHGHLVLRALIDAGYPNIYHHLDYDNVTGVSANEPGWKTSLKTKPLMIDTFGASIRANDLGSWSRNLMDEASGVYWEGSKIKKSAGGFDDELDAVSIALMVREQTPIESAVSRYRPVSYVKL